MSHHIYFCFCFVLFRERAFRNPFCYTRSTQKNHFVSNAGQIQRTLGIPIPVGSIPYCLFAFHESTWEPNSLLLLESFCFLFHIKRESQMSFLSCEFWSIRWDLSGTLFWTSNSSFSSRTTPPPIATTGSDKPNHFCRFDGVAQRWTLAIERKKVS